MRSCRATQLQVTSTLYDTRLTFETRFEDKAKAIKQFCFVNHTLISVLCALIICKTCA